MNMPRPSEKLSITLTAEMAEMIRGRIEAGEYTSVSEFLRDSVRAWQREQQRLTPTDDELRRIVEAADQDPRDLTADEVFSPIHEKLDRLERGD